MYIFIPVSPCSWDPLREHHVVHLQQRCALVVKAARVRLHWNCNTDIVFSTIRRMMLTRRPLRIWRDCSRRWSTALRSPSVWRTNWPKQRPISRAQWRSECRMTVPENGLVAGADYLTSLVLPGVCGMFIMSWLLHHLAWTWAGGGGNRQAVEHELTVLQLNLPVNRENKELCCS